MDFALLKTYRKNNLPPTAAFIHTLLETRGDLFAMLWFTCLQDGK